MKVQVLLVALAAASLPGALAAQATPLSKTIDLLGGLKAKVLKEGEAEEKAFGDYEEWCDDTCNNIILLLKSLGEKKDKAAACMAKAEACVETCATDTAELAASIATAEDELKNATLIRAKEHADFLAGEAELMEAIDALSRAVTVLEREMAKNPALLQQADTSSAEKLVKSLGVVIEAAAFSVPDQRKLLALVQARAKSEESDDAALDSDEAALGAPDAAAYKSHSGTIVDVLEEMLEKAEAELKDLRTAEATALHNYDLLKQSLTDEIAADKKAMAETKAKQEDCQSDLAACTADFGALVKDIAASEAELKAAQDTCMTVAADHEASKVGRAEEVKALTEAIEILTSTTPGASSQTYSLLQVAAGSKLKSRLALASSEVVGFIRKLARRHRSAALAQLASRIAAEMRYGARAGDDPFAKVKGLITGLIDRLLEEAEAEATEKAYCDEEMAKTEAKKGELEEDIEKLTAKIEKDAALSASLKEEVKELQAELAALAAEQAEMDKIRKEENTAFLASKADLELGLAGVRKALEVLRDYYGAAFLQQPPMPKFHEKASGAGGSIIDILEVVETDFASELAKRTTEEDDAQAAYEKMSQENKVIKVMKEQDAKYKTQEFVALDKAVGELSADLDTEKAELDAVLDYYDKLKERCIAKPETYAERKKRRDAEIAGLKEALTILDGETALVQRGSRSAAALKR